VIARQTERANPAGFWLFFGVVSLLPNLIPAILPASSTQNRRQGDGYAQPATRDNDGPAWNFSGAYGFPGLDDQRHGNRGL